MPIPYITAHSGCENTPRDSMDSIEQAIQAGADIVEMDIRRAPDGVLRISHNQLEQTNDGEKPTLESVFLRLKDTPLALNCDLKEQCVLYEMLDMASSLGFGKERLILSGCTSPEQLARDPSLSERAQIYLNIEEILKFIYLTERQDGYDSRFTELMVTPWSFLDTFELTDERLEKIVLFAQVLHICGINLPVRHLTGRTVEIFRTSGTAISVWTVNDAETLERCIRSGVRNITTLAPRLAIAIRQQLYPHLKETPGRIGDAYGKEYPDR